jgi:RNA polymerase sigma-70 factor (ECF subfamily)
MAQKSVTPSERIGDPASWVDRYGDALLRFACSRVADTEVAEDLVQETFLAAFRHREKFAGDSSLGTWLVAILRRKIADHYRAAGRTPESLDDASLEGMEPFSKRGKWLHKYSRWHATPAQLAETHEFWQVFWSCLEGLPSHLAQAFQLRELVCATADEASLQIGITSKNLGVRLHRARLLLRQCLDRKWFRQ